MTKAVADMDLVVKMNAEGEYVDTSDYIYVFPDVVYMNGTMPLVKYVWKGYKQIQGVIIRKVNGKQ